MTFEIVHTTTYEYSSPVFFEPHYFRLIPKVTAHAVVHDFSMSISPSPTGYSDQNDTENNAIRLCWFDGMHQQMKVEVSSIVEVADYNPFDFLIHPSEYLQVPFKYDDYTHKLLQANLEAKALPVNLLSFVQAILKETEGKTVDFLLALTQRIHREFVVETRETGEPLEPAITFESRRGSCRDLACMQINMLRHLGIATRFVSGYFYIDVEQPTFELHAWVEVFLPGAGWVGFDPSHGLLTGASHIPLASSAFPQHTMPVSGTVRGDARSSLSHNLIIKKRP